MVAHPRATLGAGHLRPLNGAGRRSRSQPQIAPAAPLGECAAAPGAASHARSAEIQDRWRIDDEWWRERPIARLYHALLLDDGSPLVLYHDLIEEQWYEQRG